VVAAADELPAVVRELERQGCMRAGDRIGLLGFSAGGAAALLDLADRRVPIGTAILLNPSTGLSASVQAFEHATHRSYQWTPRSRALAARTDAVQRAADIAHGAPPPAILLIAWSEDDIIAHASLVELEKTLTPFYAKAGAVERFQHLTVQGLAHNLSDSRPEDQWSRRVSGWFNRYL